MLPLTDVKEIKRNLTDEELGLLDVLEDPIWFGEFLRSTAGASENKEEHPKESWSYRPYQKDLLTDYSERIVLTGGRAIGKCQPISARVLTYPYGYLTIFQILTHLNNRNFVVYAMNENNQFVQRRAYMKEDKTKPCFKVMSASGYTVEATGNHPILTQRGFIPIDSLDTTNDLICVMNRLPHESSRCDITWHELRLLGYMLADHEHNFSSNAVFFPKYKAQLEELRHIAEAVGGTLVEHTTGGYKIGKRSATATTYFTRFAFNFDLVNMRSGTYPISRSIKEQNLQGNKVLLESFISMCGEFNKDSINIKCKSVVIMEDIRELLLRFSIKTRVIDFMTIVIDDVRSYYRFIKTFNIPGVRFRELPDIPFEDEMYSFEKIQSIVPTGTKKTYAIEVLYDQNYVSGNVVVHNTVVLTDKIIYNSFNNHLMYPQTKESLFATANSNQLAPVIDKIVSTFASSRLLAELIDKFNKSQGTYDFKSGERGKFRLNTRIAGLKAEQNVVGMHVPEIFIDEAQIFPSATMTQLEPTLNHWEKRTQIFMCGVPNGQREGNVLYFADMVSNRYKKYRVPSHANPYFSMEANVEAIKKYGGEDSSDYIHLVTGRHGSAMYQLISRNDFRMVDYDFYSYQAEGEKTWQMTLKKPAIKFNTVVAAIDTGFVDATIINVIAYDEKLSAWKTIVRYRLTKVPFAVQADIIHWLDSDYRFNHIGIDFGAGGNGMAVASFLQSEVYPKNRAYNKRIMDINFAENVSTQDDAKVRAKTWGAQELARMILSGQLVFAEIDLAGVSELERVTYAPTENGALRFFVLNESGRGKSNEDHIFASYLVFAIMLYKLESLSKRRSVNVSINRWI